MNPHLPGLNLVQKPGNILIILRLRLGQPRVLPHTFQALPPSDPALKRRDTGHLLPVRLPSRKGQHVPQVQSRVPYGTGIKRHIIHHGQVRQYIPA